MLLVPRIHAERQGDDICRELKARGLTPLWVGFNGDQDIGIEFALLGERRPGWQKAFAKARVEATADAFVAELTAWKVKVLTEIRADKPSPTVRNAIAVHGLDVILEMLGAVQ